MKSKEKKGEGKDRIIIFTVNMLAVPKQSTKGKMLYKDGAPLLKNGKPVISYRVPKNVESNATMLSDQIAQHRPDKPLEGPLCLQVCVYYPWRKSEPKKNRTQPKPKDTRPDLDNLVKQVKDVLQACGFFLDDSQVTCLIAYKRWWDTPMMEIKIWPDTGGKQAK